MKITRRGFVALVIVAVSKAACPTITTYPNSLGWAPGAQITVYVVSAAGGFSDYAQSSISTAFNNWTGLLNSKQSISVQNVGSVPSAPSKPYVVVQRGQPQCGISACTTFTAPNYWTDTATITVSPDMGDTGLEQVMVHEIGHSYALQDCNGCSNTAMNPAVTSNSPTGPSSCDSTAVYNNNGKYGQGSVACNCNCETTGCCLPSCCPAVSGEIASTLPAIRVAVAELSRSTVAGGVTPNNRCTPILVDLIGKGFKLTDTKSGVWFDIFANGSRTQIPWPAEGTANAWLVLDRNHNGVIDDATELFGNLTPQQPTANPNGYLALAEFDKPSEGGNGDGVIDARDRIFPSLRLWLDKNHDGVSQPDELFPLTAFGIRAIDLHYTTWPDTDANGNEFRYRGLIKDAKGSQVGRWSYDVLLVNTTRP